MERIKKALITLFCMMPVTVSALPYYGVTLSIPVVAKDPAHLTGFQLMLDYDPQLIWRQFSVYFDGGYTLYRDTVDVHNRTLNIYSIAPVVRYTVQNHCRPLYLEFSIGAAYLSQTRFDSRHLGIHYAFQDRLGFGGYMGQRQQFSIGFHAIHYSNAHLSRHNSGITVPLEIDLGYRFS